MSRCQTRATDGSRCIKAEEHTDNHKHREYTWNFYRPTDEEESNHRRFVYWESLPLSTRVSRMLSWARYDSIEELAFVPDRVLLSLRHFGVGALEEVRALVPAQADDDDPRLCSNQDSEGSRCRKVAGHDIHTAPGKRWQS